MTKGGPKKGVASSLAWMHVGVLYYSALVARTGVVIFVCQTLSMINDILVSDHSMIKVTVSDRFPHMVTKRSARCDLLCVCVWLGGQVR